MSNNIDEILLVGAGQMSIDYANVLKTLDIDLKIIGRGEKSAKIFEENTGLIVEKGGLENWLVKSPSIPNFAIIAVNLDQLANIAIALLNYGVKNILLEKPGGLYVEEIKKVEQLARKLTSQVFVAYNRRFYASVLQGQEIIKKDGGITSIYFEFTEWSHVIEKIEMPENHKEQWFLVNSTHIIDLALFFSGPIKKIHALTEASTSWHPKAAIFTGTARSESNILLSYHANWNSPGRWGVEILTRNHRLYYRPIEELHIQKIGSIKIEKVEIDDQLDKMYKPGLFKQVSAFLFGDNKENLITIQTHLNHVEHVYDKILNGT